MKADPPGPARPGPWRAGTLYFLALFSAGFALGTIRVLWIAPRLGARTAELLETPLMLGVMYAAARALVPRIAPPRTLGRRLAMGGLALGLVLSTEFGLVGPLRGMTPARYYATRDPVAGAAYDGALLLLALMPALVRRDLR